MRGLRQGDPLSPFHFLLAVKGFDVLMKALVQQELYYGCKMGNGFRDLMMHLQFADDTLLMGTKSWSNVTILKVGLLMFEAILGFKVNFHKSMLVGVNIANLG